MRTSTFHLVRQTLTTLADTPPPGRPVIRYHGGKYKVRGWIVSHFPPHRIYVEPFGGAASILLAKPRARLADIYNDLDGEVVHLFRVLRDRTMSAELERQLRLTPYAREEFEGSYVVSDDPIERARKLVIRAYMGFGSSGTQSHQRTGFRAKTRNSRTSSAQDWQNYPDALAAITERLQGVIVENRPALEVIAANNSPVTLLYCDPPYVHSTRSMHHRSCHYNHEMSDDDHRELAGALRSFQGMVALSGYRSPIYEALYGDWACVEKATWADGHKARTETLWMNPALAAQQRQLSFDENEDSPE